VSQLGGRHVFRIKKSGTRGYVQVVEKERVNGTVRQSVIATLGRTDELAASGALASLLASGARFLPSGARLTYHTDRLSTPGDRRTPGCSSDF